MLTTYLTDILKRESALSKAGGHESELMDCALEHLVRLAGVTDVVPFIARLLAQNFTDSVSQCVSFPADRYL